MAELQVKTVMEKAINNPKLQPYLWKEVIDRYSEDSFNLLLKYGMFKPEHRNEDYGWEALNFIEIYLRKYKNSLSNDIVPHIKSIINDAMAIGNEDYRLYRQVINIYSVMPSNHIIQQDIEVLKEIVTNRDPRQTLLHYLHYGLYTNLIAESSPIVEQLFYLFIKTAQKKNDQNLLIILTRDKEKLVKTISFNYQRIFDFLIRQLLEEIQNGECLYTLDSIKYHSLVDKGTFKLYINDKLVSAWKSKGYTQNENEVKLYIIKYMEQNGLTIEDGKLDYILKMLITYPFSENAAESIFASRKYLHDICDYILYIIKIILEKENLKIEKIEELLLNEYVLVKKIALYIIISKYDEYKSCVLKHIKEKSTAFDFIIRYYIFGDEVKRLFNCINEDIESTKDTQFIESLNEIINRGRYIPRDASQDEKIYFLQSRFRELTNIHFFNTRHQELKKISQIDYQLSAAMSFGDVETISPSKYFTHSLQELVDMSNKQIVDTFNNFDPKKGDITKTGSVSFRGANDVLSELIVAAPEKILENLCPFIKLNHIYSFGFFYGFRSLDASKLNLLKVYLKEFIEFSHEFIYERINNSKLLKEAEDNGQSAYSFIKQYMWTIEGSENTEIMNLNLFCDTVDVLINHYTEGKEEINHYIVGKGDKNIYERIKILPHYSINSVWGTTISTLIHFTKNVFKQNEKETRTLWDNKISPGLEKLYNGEDSFITYYCLGENIELLEYIDSVWCDKFVEKLELKSENWCAFIAGYSMYPRVYKETILKLVEHIKHAWDFDTIDISLRARLISKIVIAYLNNFDGFEQLLDPIINTLNSKYIEEIIRIICTIDNEEIDSEQYMRFAQKSIKIWDKVLDSIKTSKDNQAAKKVAEDLFDFIRPFRFVDKGIINRIKESISIVNEFNIYEYSSSLSTYHLTEYLASYLDSNIKELDETIYLYLTKMTPDYEESTVKKLILHMKTNKQALSEIRDAYLNNSVGRNTFVIYISELLTDCI